MDIIVNFLKFIAILVVALIVIFLVLLSLPNSKLRQSILKIYSIVSYIVTAISVIYIISPLDIVPDVIPVAGQGDDLVAAISALATAISGYVAWQKSKKKICTE
jgi:uncharacterized membrane protein YkvA (DUF1232 family)